MSIEILAGIFILFSMAALGAPVAYAILSGIIVYLGVAGQDLAIAGQTMVQRLFDGFLFELHNVFYLLQEVPILLLFLLLSRVILQTNLCPE